jgi:hypothetical protein
MKVTKTLLVLGATALALTPVSSTAQEEDGKWHFDASVNLYMAGISGDIGAQGRSVDVDSGFFEDIFDNLTAGITVRGEARKDKWFGALEVSFLKLEGEGDVGDAEAKQTMIEPTFGYQFFSFARAFGGLRYRNVDNEIDLPAVQFRDDKSWWVPIIGADLMFPLFGGKLVAKGHFDIGGFGIGSDFTWQAYPYLDWHFGRNLSAQFGYRWLGTDFDDDGFEYSVVSHGPQVGLTWNF